MKEVNGVWKEIYFENYVEEILNKQIVKELSEDPNKCPKCGGKMLMSGGCSECEDCAYSPCSV